MRFAMHVFLIVIVVLQSILLILMCDRNKKNKMMYKKMEYYYTLSDKWLATKIEGNSLNSVLMKNGYRKIGIYGMSKMGQCLYYDLTKSGCEVIYVTDQRSMPHFECFVPVDNEFPDADLLIISVMSEFVQIKEKLTSKVDCPIMSLEELLYKM